MRRTTPDSGSKRPLWATVALMIAVTVGFGFWSYEDDTLPENYHQVVLPVAGMH